MRVFKRTYPSDGEDKVVPRWYLDFQDHNDRRRRLAGFKDKRSTRQLGDTLEELCAHRQSGQSADRNLRRAVEALPARITERLGKWGLLTEDTVAMSKPLEQHISEWHEDLLRGNTEQYANQRRNRVERLAEAAGWTWWSDVNAIELERVLDEWQENPDKRLSTRTANYYRAAAKQFCKWMFEHGKASENPLRVVKQRTVKDEDKRRALTPEGCQRLISAAYDAPVVADMPGPERAMMYRLALETGMRYSELRTLKKRNLAFDSEPPTVTVEAAYAKNSREDSLPLREDTAALLEEYTARHMPQAEVFTMPDGRGAEMVKADLQRTGDESKGIDPIPFRDSAGRKVDFHALRHTFLTNLANSGVHPKTAQMLARHSSITLTMDRYTHSVLHKQSEAVGKLPALQMRGEENRERQAVGQTGDSTVSLTVSNCGHSRSQSVPNCQSNSPNEKDPSNPETGPRGHNNVVRAGGIEPTANGLKVRCST